MTSGYVLTTPVLNEMETLPALLGCVAKLDPLPLCWLVVDDGSDDGSRQWLAQQAEEHPWLVVRDAPESGNEYLGGHIARIKRWGLEQVLAEARARGAAPGYAGVLDADVDLPSEHYGRLIEHFEREPSLGIVSSVLHVPLEHGTVAEPLQRTDLPRGPTQFFRVTCLDDIGGLPPWPGFDGAANVKARTRGWTTRLCTDVIAVHKRPTATRYGHAPGFTRKGQYAWFLGVHPLLVMARAAAYAHKGPASAGWHFLRGYAGDALNGVERCPDLDVRRENGLRRVARAVQAKLGLGLSYVPED